MTSEEQAAYYSALYRKYGDGYRGADWGSEGAQNVRLDVLACAIGEKYAPKHHVLDVGCGAGPLVSFLHPRQVYTGWDISPVAVEVARAQYNRTFVVQNILDAPPGLRYDCVVASGLFTHGDQDFFWSALRKMWSLTTGLLAVNMLTTWGGAPVEGEFRQYLVAVLPVIKGWTGKFRVLTDYLGVYDVTLILYR